MTFSFEEAPGWGQETARPPSFVAVYRATGEFNSYLVQEAALSLTPPAIIRPYGKLYRQDIQTEPDGWASWIVTVPYGPLTRETGSVNFSFDTTGATINIKAAKAHVASYSVGGGGTPDAVNWHKGAINVKEDGEVEGCEIIIPALKITYELKHPQGFLGESQAKVIASITGKTNSAPFRSFAAGELLFAGATGSDGTDAEASVQYQFIASSNATGLTIGEITGIAKAGHDIAWVEFKDDTESGEAVRRPKRVHIDRVYDSVNFAAFLGWGG